MTSKIPIVRQIGWISIIPLILIFCVNACSNSQKEIQLIGYYKGFGMVVDNEMRYYELDDNGQWKERTNFKLSLPEGYKSIISFPEGVGVVIGNEMRYYGFDYNIEQWKEDKEFRFPLPKGYKSIFGFFTGVGAAIGKEMSYFISAGNGRWKEDTENKVSLPKGYKSIIRLNKGFGVIVGNEMRYYKFTGNGQWIEDTDYRFSLPKGYKSIINFSYPEGVGVVIGNEMRYYELIGNGYWSENTDYKFILPKLEKIKRQKKQKEKKVIEPENKEIIPERKTANEEIKLNAFEYRGIPNFYYADIWDLLKKYNEEWERKHPNGYENDDITNVMKNDYFYVDGSLEDLSYIKIDIDKSEGETWFSSWRIFDNGPYIYWYNYVYILDKNKKIVKMYRIPLNIYGKGGLYGYILIEFPILKNLPGKFGVEAWLYDINGDGFDEIISLYDHDVYQGDHEEELHIYGGTSIFQGIRPESQFYVMGYDKNIDNFVNYLNIRVTTVDKNDGPEPVQYVQNQGVWGFKCLVDKSKYNSIYGLPAAESEDLIWIFFTWDSDKKKYIEKKFVEE